jgi:hypothetical protein
LRATCVITDSLDWRGGRAGSQQACGPRAGEPLVNPAVNPTTAQLEALREVRRRAETTRSASLARIRAVLDLLPPPADGPESRSPETLVRGLLARGRIALHFHPDRLLANGRAARPRPFST